jgi:hypothetical protein
MVIGSDIARVMLDVLVASRIRQFARTLDTYLAR